MTLPDGREETPEVRVEACCASEPECVLCPLRPENAGRSLAELWRLGLYAKLPDLGFKAAHEGVQTGQRARGPSANPE